MLKRLHRKFIIINMLLVSFVLILGLSFTYYKAHTTAYDNIKSSLSQSISYAQGGSLQNPFAAEQYNFTTPDGLLTNEPTVTISIDAATGNIIGVQQHLMSMADSTINVAVAAIMEKQETLGRLPSMHLYYEKINADGIIYIAFASTNSVETLLQETLLNLIVGGLITMLLFFFVIVLLVTFAIGPVKKSWKQQQQFVANASHELKTPLTVIIANSNILLSEKRQSVEEQRKWISNTLSEAQHMKTLIDHLLILASSESSHQSYPLRTLNFSELLLNCILQFEPVAFERHLSLTYDLPPRMKIKGNEIGLKQVINIFLDNACKYAGKNGHIHVCLFYLGNYIRLSVHNTGSLIPKEDLPHIFERFYRSDKTRTLQGEKSGYGLGLSIARSIVHRHGGQCFASSDEKKGTTFIAQFKK